MKVQYNENYVASGYAFDTTRKAAAIARSLLDDPIEGVTIEDPGPPLTAGTIIQEVHGERYLRALETGTPRWLAEGQGFDWDDMILPMAEAHATGLVIATHDALSNGSSGGSLSSGLHHASRDRGAGFCTINGLAVAVTAAHIMGAGRVLVLDFDAHCGGGTFSILEDDPGFVQVDVSVVRYDEWTPTGDHYLDIGGRDGYVQRIDRALQHADGLGGFDLILYNAGMDPINSGVSRMLVQERERMVREFVAGTPAVFALAGGYTSLRHSMDDVVEWHRMTIREWARL